jgi:hypothetical protein
MGVYQLVTMNEQLPLIPHDGVRHPDAGKTVFYQQLQSMAGIALIRLLLAHVAGTNPGGVADLHLMS